MPDQLPECTGETRRAEPVGREAALYRALVENALEYAVYAIDLDGRVVVWNGGAERLTGYRQEEVLGRPVALFLGPEDRRDRVPEREMEAALRYGRAEERHWHLRKDGTRFWAKETIEVLCDELAVRVGFTVVLRDETERRLAGQERAAAVDELRRLNSRLLIAGIREQEARQAAEAAGHAKDEFLAIVSHELRTPLNAILGWVQVLRSNSTDQALASRALEIIERNSILQKSLVDDLLDVSRSLLSGLRISSSPLDLVPVVAAAVDAVRPSAEAKGVRLDALLDAPVGLVWADPGRLRQIMANLLSNAVKFTPAGGGVEVALTREDGRACIRVRDTGCGIDPEFLPHAFDRFSQADATTRRHYGGLGLGLAIVRHLVELQGGTVGAESAGEGQGSTLTVRLRLGAPEAPRATAVRDGPAERHDETPEVAQTVAGVRVLIVEDDADAREVYTLMLNCRGASVTAVESAREALDAFDREPPDVLVSDIGLPGEDGFDLIRAVRARPPERGGAVPAAAMTAYASREDEARALRAGFQTHVAKPVGAVDLVAVIARLAAGHTGGAR